MGVVIAFSPYWKRFSQSTFGAFLGSKTLKADMISFEDANWL